MTEVGGESVAFSSFLQGKWETLFTTEINRLVGYEILTIERHFGRSSEIRGNVWTYIYRLEPGLVFDFSVHEPHLEDGEGMLA